MLDSPITAAVGRRSNWLPHAVLWIGVFITAFPLYVTFVASTLLPQDIAQVPMQLFPGTHGWDNYREAWSKGSAGTYLSPPAATLLLNSLIVALVVTFGKISVSLLSAYAVVFFKFPGRMIFFWMIFITLMLPVEVRILPTYQVVTDLKLINSYAGLTLPIIASATATLLFRQFFLTIPDELVEAAKIDGAGPLRFFKDVVIPLSRTNIAALFVILFIYGWNQYLWPLLITTSNSLDVIVVAIKKMIGTGAEPTDWHIVMSTTILALIPPVLVIILMQKSFVKGLTDTEK
ncbi:MAG TPA: sn-glycerol-3-phosphate ABC transporter permease UgpE [Casimicrobium huifangae]|uniref:sn-glycerol-3-phosphate ABC transporter permease UgpE n=1 Tax=Casimicrobium huifangae TaxID=2591109 RepID=UPI002BFBB595|nr:sn-glycerol-3-phosphate ABC transporter permease UgpE [Casimicrobium huifangae]HQA33619.1 sn-glycerol-3-phosphate ABC transporter permease UgpE [Casimicrobium huifangae]HQD64274.1 sn-glycerol-3-phosphate ABC transporter permease UgpE [Casimicrobium huifangae]